MRATGSDGVRLRRIAARTAVAYLAALALWFVVWVGIGDRWWWLFAVNSMALYLFAPLSLVPIAAIITKRWLLIPAALPGVLLWVYLWGGLFVGGTATSPADAPVLRVMTYNLLGSNDDTEAVLESIISSGAGVVGLQELNPRVAAAIDDRLSDEYPYRELRPQAGVHGYGFLSRYPFSARRETLPDPDWINDPLILDLEFGQQPVTVVIFHAAAGVLYRLGRDRQAEKLAAFARSHDGALIIMGDLNATSTNAAYETMTGTLKDAWREAGRGFGHTFPGASKSSTPGSSRPGLLGISVPKWLVRIDYVFHSKHWLAVSARVGRFDGASDHRPVIADLALLP